MSSVALILSIEKKPTTDQLSAINTICVNLLFVFFFCAFITCQQYWN